jgi:spore germination protein
MRNHYDLYRKPKPPSSPEKQPEQRSWQRRGLSFTTWTVLLFMLITGTSSVGILYAVNRWAPLVKVTKPQQNPSDPSSTQPFASDNDDPYGWEGEDEWGETDAESGPSPYPEAKQSVPPPIHNRWHSTDQHTPSDQAGRPQPSSPVVAPPTVNRPVPSIRPKVAVYVPYWQTNAATTSFQRHTDSIDTAYFVWYEIKQNGTIGLIPSAKVNEKALTLARQHRIQIIFSLGNGWDPKRLHYWLETADRRRFLAKQIVQWAERQRIDGVELNLEPLLAEDREPLSNFVVLVARNLHAKRKQLHISVFPKTREPGGWSGQIAQDWPHLGRYADKVNIMTFNYSLKKPGPGTPLTWLVKVLDFAVTQIPVDKIQVVFPWVGQLWKTDGTSPDPLTYSSAQVLLRNGWPLLRDANHEPYLVNRRDGKTQTGYFQDTISYKAKLDVIIQRYPHIGGVTHWYIGTEDPKVWMVIEQAMRSNRLK